MIPRNYPIIIGRKDSKAAHKGIIVYVCNPQTSKVFNSGVDVKICELENEDGSIIQGDENFPIKKMSSLITHLHFCSKESLQGFIKVLQTVESEWKDDDNERNE